MIAVINDSGAILYDLSEREADTYAGRTGLLADEPMKTSVGWLFIERDMGYRILSLGVTVCYVDIDRMRTIPSGITDYMKISTIEFLNIWNQLYPTKKRIKSKEVAK